MRAPEPKDDAIAPRDWVGELDEGYRAAQPSAPASRQAIDEQQAVAAVSNVSSNDDKERSYSDIVTDLSTVSYGTNSIPIDHFFVNQYALQNTGQNGGTVGADINVVDAWDDFTGAGVNVGIIDDGIDYNHQDLDTNYNAALHAVVSGTVIDGFHPDHDGRHGTAVAGIIGAERNGTDGTDGGTVGVAYGASLTSVAGIPANDPSGDGTVTPPIGLVDMVTNLERFDVVNNSWGFNTGTGTSTTGATVANRNDAGFNSFYAALDTQWVNGRDGNGTTFVKSAGNDRTNGGTSSQSGLNNHEDVVTVGALNNTGFVAQYSNGGASVLISAPGGPFAGDTWTTDRLVEGYDGIPGATDFTNGFNGTSAAAPFVSGVVALMLEANPNLGYRDVQDILAYSASHTGSAVGAASGGFEQYQWIWNNADDWNGGGLHFSEDYGYGRIDAKAAVRLAESWTETSNRANRATTFEDDVNTTFAIPDNDLAGLTLTINELTAIDVEAVTVDIAMDPSHTWVGDLRIILTSPEGTSVDLWTNNYGSQNFPGRFTFGSQAFRGETSAGDWTVQFIDSAGGDVGSVTDIDLRTYGSTSNNDDHFIFTDEYSDYDGVGGHGTVFAGGAGANTINAAAVSGNTTVDLTSNTGTIDGVAITNSNINRVYTGDGNDTIVGDNVSSYLNGGRGNDNITGGSSVEELIGGAGNDTLNGGAGVDTLTGGLGDDTYVNLNDGDTFVELAGQGNDTIQSAFSFILNPHPHVENLTLTGTGTIDGLGNSLGNIIRGNDARNGLAGGNGSDLLIGNGGDDSLDGQNGADIMRGGTGSDGYHVDRVDDVVEEDFNGGEFDIVRTAVTLTLPDNVEIGILKGGSGNPINITGNDGTTNDIQNLMLGNDSVNTITTFGGRDVILGRGGADTINAGAGRDNIAGGLGADIITGGAGDDLFNYTNIAEAGDLITDFTIADVDVLDLRAMFDTFVGGAALDTNTAQAGGYLTLTDNGSSISVFADADGDANNNVLVALLQNVTDDVSVVDNFILV